MSRPSKLEPSNQMKEFINKSMITMALALVSVIMIQQCSSVELHSRHDVAISVIDSLEQSIDAHGSQITELLVLNVSLDEAAAGLRDAQRILQGRDDAKAAQIIRLQELLSGTRQRIRDMGGKIKSMTALIAEAATRDTIALTDTIIIYKGVSRPAWIFDLSDQHRSVYGEIYPSLKEINLTTWIDLSMTHTVYSEGGIRKVDVRFDNPYIRTGNAYTIDVGRSVRPPSRIGIGPYIGVDQRFRPSIGVSAHYTLIRL